MNLITTFGLTETKPSLPKDLVTVAAAARAMGINPQRLRYWIRVGELAAHGSRRRYKVSLADVLRVSKYMADGGY